MSRTRGPDLFSFQIRFSCQAREKKGKIRQRRTGVFFRNSLFFACWSWPSAPVLEAGDEDDGGGGGQARPDGAGGSWSEPDSQRSTVSHGSVMILTGVSECAAHVDGNTRGWGDGGGENRRKQTFMCAVNPQLKLRLQP